LATYKSILPILALTLISMAVSASLFYSLRITSRIRVEYPPNIKIGVYTSSDCTVIVTEIDWGTLTPGGVATRPIYIRNEGNIPVKLTLSAEAWNPTEAKQYFALNWNYDGSQIAAGKGVGVELQLTIFANCTGITSFTFDIVITAWGA